MKKIIFWGDGIMSGPAGYADLLVNYVFLHHPAADAAIFKYGGEESDLQDAVRETPLHVIGKAPDLVLLGFGYTDLSAGKSPGEIFRIVQSVTQLMLQKTHAHVCLPNLVSSFFAGDENRENSHALNRELEKLTSPRITVLDLESRVEAFLSLHKQGPGEKRALHLDSSRLTVLGRLFLAHSCYELVPWPHWQPETVLPAG